MLRPNLAVADRSMNDFLRRKSLPGKVIHSLRPRGHHPARRGQYVTVTQWCARQAHPTKTTNRHSAGIRAAGTHYPTRQLVRDQTSPALSCLRGNEQDERSRTPHRPPTSCMTWRVVTLVFSRISEAPRLNSWYVDLPISHIMSTRREFDAAHNAVRSQCSWQEVRSQSGTRRIDGGDPAESPITFHGAISVSGSGSSKV